MKSMQVFAVCLVAIISVAVAKPQVPLDTPEVAAAKAAHFAAHYAARTGYIHPYYSPVIPAALPYIAAARAVADQSGAYVHDPSGDVAVPYLHDPSGDYASAYAYALPYAAPLIVNGVPVDTPEVAAAKAAHLAAHAALG